MIRLDVRFMGLDHRPAKRPYTRRDSRHMTRRHRRSRAEPMRVAGPETREQRAGHEFEHHRLGRVRVHLWRRAPRDLLPPPPANASPELGLHGHREAGDGARGHRGRPRARPARRLGQGLVRCAERRADADVREHRRPRPPPRPLRTREPGGADTAPCYCGSGTRPNVVTRRISLFGSALAVSGTIFLILEMYAPYQGLIQIPKAPLRAAIAQLG